MKLLDFDSIFQENLLSNFTCNFEKHLGKGERGWYCKSFLSATGGRTWKGVEEGLGKVLELTGTKGIFSVSTDSY